MSKLLQLATRTCNLLKPHNHNALPICKFSSKLFNQESRVNIAEHKINFLKVGNGSHNLLCMPGALGTIWSDFKLQIEGIDKDKFTIVAWDPPGYGKSRPPEKNFCADFYDKDADAAQQLMQVLNISQYSILGWSDGGITGMILAAKYPANVNKLVIWGANSFILPTELEMYDKIKDVSKWSAKMRQPMIDIYGEKDFPVLWENWVTGIQNLYKEKKGDICTALLEEIKCPTFILHGRKDPMIENVHVSHLHTNISNSRIHVYPEGKHNIHLKYAEDFNKRVQEFLLEGNAVRMQGKL